MTYLNAQFNPFRPLTDSSCISSKVIVFMLIHMSHVSDSWDMLNHLCFQVYAQKFILYCLSIGENGYAFFDILTNTRAHSGHRYDSQLKISDLK